jgi:fructuronate reductase
MIILNKESLKNHEAWTDIDVALPQFDIEQVKKNTYSTPEWVHFGAGNIFRGFIANAHQKILDVGLAETGIIAVDSFDFEVIEKVYKPFDDLSLLVLMNANGEFDKKVIASIVESIAADYNNEGSFERLTEIFENPSLQMVSFTITEKGYGLKSPDGDFYGVIKHDIENGLNQPLHTMSMIVSLLYKRYLKGQYPVTLVSMDNCSHNGDKLKKGVETIAYEWLKKGFVESEFLAYLLDDQIVSFPLSMIDKITPRPAEVVETVLSDLGIQNMKPIITAKNSFMAPFVNAEISEYLVIEDKFTNGRPALENAGIIFTDRETVNKVETMKVTTCLNPLHTALAVSGSLLGYTLIADQVKDPEMKKLIETIGYTEGLPVVVNPGIINPKDFIDEVVNERFANPYIPDTPQRIATDTSQKVAIRFGETIKSYIRHDALNPEELTAIPLAIALWCRYLMAVDDKGQPFELSSDPLLELLTSSLSGVTFGGTSTGGVKHILSNENIFGLDLYSIGLGEKIEKMFKEMIAGNGAVRATLKKYL